jgi:hypothetical protein
MGNGAASQTAMSENFSCRTCLGIFGCFVLLFWDMGFVQVRGSSWEGSLLCVFLTSFLELLDGGRDRRLVVWEDLE